jgi:ATP-dependent helicase/nuclease subunit A
MSTAASRTLPDRAARDRIATDLDTNLLVEAGAGSGKTRSLVGRMVALVATGAAEVSEIAAVTFTRKAAGELRERFQEALEEARTSARPPSDVAVRLELALREIDRAFMGTIHAFCARLLREQPLEAGIDPSFRETTAQEADRIAARFWTLHLERLTAASDPILDELAAVGLRPQELWNLFAKMREYPDVDFPTEEVPFPAPGSIRAAREALEGLIDEAASQLPREEPSPEWDPLQRWIRRLLYQRSAGRWQDDHAFLNTLADFCGVREHEATLKRWPDRAAAGELKGRANRFIKESPAAHTARLWQAHRYPVALRFARDSASALARHRRVSGQLDFQDLLLLTADLLRQSPAARRHLGGRYRRLLVDEFQDTDPLQAEILFLLASDPDEDAVSAGSADWHGVTPRPGALFVVGDPKQSIYRFRRADIQLYGQVRERFRVFGDVVGLEANFRSCPPVADLVNAVFSGPLGFPEQGTVEQAPFARLVPQREPRGIGEGIRFYRARPAGNRAHEIATWDADALAEWIARRIESGERRPGDFLVLLRTKHHLERYARALEVRNLPVRVSGAPIGVEHELGEVRVLLRALADPGDPVKTVSALVGLFFGLDHRQLLEHRRAGGGFDFRFARGEARCGAVEEALRTLHRWWGWSRSNPADGVVARIVDELGLLPHAAAGELGGVRAGALSFALDALRSAGLAGDTSLGAALEAMDAALTEEETEAPLEPGRPDVIRVMNLHKAKGLEAGVVILARPFDSERPDDEVFIERSAGGTRGWIRVKDERGKKARVLARPLSWEEKESALRAFESAEEVRLLYVAATRAQDELVVALPKKEEKDTPWRLLHGWLRAHADELALDAGAAPTREQLPRRAEDLLAEERQVEAARGRAALESWRFVTVTRLAKVDATAAAGPGLERTERSDREAPPAEGRPLLGLDVDDGPGGYAWGTAVHGVLEAASRGAAGDRLRTLARSLLLELDRPAEDGEPSELEALLATAERVIASDLWRRARSAARTLAEVPFTLRRPDRDPPTYLEGVIDLAFREQDGWVVVDYKTDRGDDPHFATRREAYRAQLSLYGEAWQALTGETVKQRLLWYVRSGVIEEV